jgi:hypothetical protein
VAIRLLALGAVTRDDIEGLASLAADLGARPRSVTEVCIRGQFSRQTRGRRAQNRR